MDKNTIKFEESDANHLAAAVREQIKNGHWDPLDEDDWAQLTALKQILIRLYAFLDNEFDNRNPQVKDLV